MKKIAWRSELPSYWRLGALPPHRPPTPAGRVPFPAPYARSYSLERGSASHLLSGKGAWVSEPSCQGSIAWMARDCQASGLYIPGLRVGAWRITLQLNRYCFDFGVLLQAIFTEFSSNSRLLKPAKWGSGVNGIVTIHPNRSSSNVMGDRVGF